MDPAVAEYLTLDDAELKLRWRSMTERLTARFGKEMTMESILFLVGVQSQGMGFQPNIDRERKQELIMEGTYCVFEKLGVYERAGMDEHGLWLWERKVPMPSLSVEEQGKLLSIAILEYFADESDQDD